MKIITVRKKEGLPCSICEEIINYGEEAFQFFNKTPNSDKPFKLHWQHPLCSYNSKSRSWSFREYMDYFRDKQNKKEAIKRHGMIQCPHCRNSSKVFLNDYALNQHLKDKHGINTENQSHYETQINSLAS